VFTSDRAGWDTRPNFAWREDHNGEGLWLVRKGATPAFSGQRGFIGRTMGEISTVHGAGRVMGRMEAKGKADHKTGEVKRAGKVTQSMMDQWVTGAQVELRFE
jgi:tRNA-splicing ligase RtcB